MTQQTDELDAQVLGLMRELMPGREYVRAVTIARRLGEGVTVARLYSSLGRLERQQLIAKRRTTYGYPTKLREYVLTSTGRGE